MNIEIFLHKHLRIYPTDEQVIQLSKDFGATRWL
ncbi:helix-turn-helix domain-containing protein [Phormidesmis priestleyi]